MAESPRSGYLTVYSADRSEIYGEIAGAVWEREDAGTVVNHVFSGPAGEGTAETFFRLNAEGIDHVAFDFEAEGQKLSGTGHFLRPERAEAPAGAIIRIATTEEPQAG